MPHLSQLEVMLVAGVLIPLGSFLFLALSARGWASRFPDGWPRSAIAPSCVLATTVLLQVAAG